MLLCCRRWHECLHVLQSVNSGTQKFCLLPFLDWSSYIYQIMPLYHASLSLQTTLPMFLNKTFSVRRRFSDFLGLYEKISAKHSLLGCIIPPPPQKSVVGKEFLMLTLAPCLVELVLCSSRHSHWPGYMRMFTLSSLLALTCIILLGAVRCDLLTERVVWCVSQGWLKWR